MDENLEADKRRQAQLAMEGAEHMAKREQLETKQKLIEESSALEKQLAGINKQKEEFELAWIDLDSQRKKIHINVAPIAEEEKKAEAEEADLETQESQIGLAADKHAVEEKRWAVQGKRQELEKKRWAEEQKVVEIEKTIEKNTAQYRMLLDQEDKIQTRLTQIKADLAK